MPGRRMPGLDSNSFAKLQNEADDTGQLSYLGIYGARSVSLLVGAVRWGAGP